MKRTPWYEVEIFRQFQAVFNESIHQIRDCGHMVAIHTRNIGVQAAEMEQIHWVNLSVRFMNTFLRASINKKDVRTAYNLFNEYRSMAEALMLSGQTELTVEIGERFKFYGQLAFTGALPFILETAAYDLCALLEKAQDPKCCTRPLLDIFLDVDREPEGETEQEASLRGVRRHRSNWQPTTSFTTKRISHAASSKICVESRPTVAKHSR